MSGPLTRTLGVTSIEAFFQGVGRRVAGALPDGSQVTFEIEGEGGGTWTLTRVGDEIVVKPGRGTWTDSLLGCTVPDFVDVITGQTDLRDAYNDGRIRVEGDIGLLLRLREALPIAA